MLRNILIGVDGSADSDRAVELGIQWAGKFHAKLTGLGVVDEPSITRSVPLAIGDGYFPSGGPEMLAVANRQVAETLQLFETRCAEAGVACSVLQDVGFPDAEIVREALRCDLLVLGHTTHFGFGSEERADNTLWRILKNTARPVTVVPSASEPGNSVLIAYDGSPSADRALQAFEASGLDLGEPVYVASVGAHRWEAKSAERAAEFLRLHEISAQAVAREFAGSVARSILDEVQRRNARLLVMGSRGHSALREFLFGSVTRAVLNDSPVPVFLCH